MISKREMHIDAVLEELLESPTSIAPREYQYYLGLTKRRLIFNDTVTNDIVEKLIIPLIDMDEDGTGEPIEIIMCSPGGSTFDGLIFCDVIDRLKTPTTIKVMGYAYSMGGIFLSAGSKNPHVTKVCYPFSTALLHGGDTLLQGNSYSVKDTFEFHKRIDHRIKEYILSNTKITAEEYEKMERSEWYMDSETMLEKGLVDKIL